MYIEVNNYLGPLIIVFLKMLVEKELPLKIKW